MKMTLTPFGESDYNELLLQAVAVLDQARSSLAIKISDTISNAHWNLGKLLTEKKLESKHGSAVVNRLSSDLKRRFPDMGVSPRNLWNMKRFYERYRNEDEKLLQAVAVLPWGHNLILLDKGLDSTRVMRDSFSPSSGQIYTAYSCHIRNLTHLPLHAGLEYPKVSLPSIKPSQKRLEEIYATIRQIGKELMAV